jgi:hypothetical protein
VDHVRSTWRVISTKGCRCNEGAAKYAKLAKRVEELDARIGRRRRICLRAIVDDGDEAEPMARALAAHPGDAGLTVGGCDWLVITFRDPQPCPRPPGVTPGS